MNNPLTEQELNQILAEPLYKVIPIMNDVTRYPFEQVRELVLLYRQLQKAQTKEQVADLLRRFEELRDQIQLLPNAPQRHYLWPKGKVPAVTEYLENSDYRYWHGPDFEPYYLEVLLPEDVKPKGAVVCVGGNQLGANVINEAYQTCLEFNELGYQCFILICRPNGAPWSAVENGADVARCIRMIRANAEKYRIDPKRIAMAGCSNGGRAGGNCIMHFSGEQKMTDYFPEYVPDAFDAYDGCQDIFLCIYGAFPQESEKNFDKVVYPPTFYAVGLEDTRFLENLKKVMQEQFAINNRIEVHTFAGVRHGKAGWKILDGVGNPNFDMWVPLADVFMQDTYESVHP